MKVPNVWWIVFCAVTGTFLLICYKRYDKSENFQRIGNVILMLKLCGTDKSQLLVGSVIFFALALMMVLSRCGLDKPFF